MTFDLSADKIVIYYEVFILILVWKQKHDLKHKTNKLNLFSWM